MPIYIEQKFQRCDNCGRMIPLRMKPLVLEASDKKLFFCSDWCLQYYKSSRHSGNPSSGKKTQTHIQVGSCGCATG